MASSNGKMQKTQAKEFFCLTEKDLEPLAFEEKPNRRYKNATPTKLYSREELEAVAAAKWGSVEQAEAEREKRSDKKRQRALEATQEELSRPSKVLCGDGGDGAGAAGEAPEPIPGVDVPGELPCWISERIRTVRDSASSSAGAQAASGSRAAPGRTEPHCVLYWMSTAIRGHENPALDVAKAEARRAGLPLVVAAFLLSSHGYPSQRRLKFWLEGLKDTQKELRAQDLELLVYLDGFTKHSDDSTGAIYIDMGDDAEEQGAGTSAGWRALVALANRAAVVVTEEMPVSPEAQWLQDLKEQAAVHVRILAVDTACVMPAHLVKCSTEKAYIYRSSTLKGRREHIEGMPYRDAGDLSRVAPYARSSAECVAGAEEHPDAAGPSSSAATGNSRQPVLEGLGWEPLDLTASECDILDMLDRCPWVDISVGGITHTTGGSTAGYTRWEIFKRGGLASYAAKRNTAMQRNGVSRLSAHCPFECGFALYPDCIAAYHHFGMVSPFKVARDAASSSSNGASKFYDEFATWRELSYAACLRMWPNLETMQALPEWARKTLQKHASDPRPHFKTDEQLEKGTTGDAMWDACQHQLVVTDSLGALLTIWSAADRLGECHNNVRMSWGKAIIPWSSSPEQALKRTIHLNHKFALDGCDPASYSGILWCFGKHDKPKQADSTPIFGSVASRPTSVLLKKMSAASYKSLAIEPDISLASNVAGGKAATASPAPRHPQKTISSFFSPRK